MNNFLIFLNFGVPQGQGKDIVNNAASIKCLYENNQPMGL